MMLRLGLRLTLHSGREAVVRLAVTTVAVAVGVALMLSVLAEFHAFQANSNQACWSCTTGSSLPSHLPSHADLWNNSVDFYQGQTITRLDVAPLGPSAPVPPGITRLPAYKSVPPSSWIGGWCVGIPRGARNPDAAWEFIRWTCASNDGTSKAGNAVSDFPGYKASSFFHKLPASLESFYPILETTQHQRPVTPAEDYYMGALNREASNALYGKKTPKQALTDCTKDVQSYLNSILKKK